MIFKKVQRVREKVLAKAYGLAYQPNPRKHCSPLVDHLLHTWFHGETGVQIPARDELFR